MRPPSPHQREHDRAPEPEQHEHDKQLGERHAASASEGGRKESHRKESQGCRGEVNELGRSVHQRGIPWPRDYGPAPRARSAPGGAGAGWGHHATFRLRTRSECPGLTPGRPLS
jgi:hypothetical protein